MTQPIEFQKENETVKMKNITNLSIWHQQYNDHYYNEEEDDDFSSVEGEEKECIEIGGKITCGCGKALSAGWNCTQCRHNCSTCHRALASEEICGRCGDDVKRGTDSTKQEIII